MQIQCTNQGEGLFDYSVKFRAFYPYGDEVILSGGSSAPLQILASYSIIRIEWGIAKIGDWVPLPLCGANDGDTVVVANVGETYVSVTVNGAAAEQVELPGQQAGAGS